jgi:hypothetical protein
MIAPRRIWPVYLAFAFTGLRLGSAGAQSNDGYRLASSADRIHGQQGKRGRDLRKAARHGAEEGAALPKVGISASGSNFVTNIFKKEDGRWLMVAHHAQRIPQ